jgi:glycosyltransferase involved in cell wall biosynthesis
MQISPEKLNVSVVIPARNEAKNLYYLFSCLPPDISEIILVDGHSTDDTIAVAQKLCPDIHIIRQEGVGKGDAMRVGFAACTQDIIVMLDSDGSADPTEMPRFVEALAKGNDFAKGSRFLKGGGSDDITLLRRIGNKTLCSLVNILFRERFTDLCYGYNVFRRSCLDAIDLDCTGFEIEAQLCLRIQRAGLKIVEVVSMEHSRIHGKSNLRTFKDGWRVLKTIFHEWRRSQQLQSDKTVALSFFTYDDIENSVPVTEKVPLS